MYALISHNNVRNLPRNISLDMECVVIKSVLVASMESTTRLLLIKMERQHMVDLDDWFSRPFAMGEAGGRGLGEAVIERKDKNELQLILQIKKWWLYISYIYICIYVYWVSYLYNKNWSLSKIKYLTDFVMSLESGYSHCKIKYKLWWSLKCF